MNKTRVDDMLIEMIRPKIEEIERKFSNNQPLTQDDINTLLLKSQYNHINHLDQKLNETVESVRNLEIRFSELENKFKILETELNGRMDRLEQELNGRMDRLEQELNGRMDHLEQDLRSQMELFKQELSGRMDALEERVEKSIQRALNRNMMLLVIVIGFFMTLMKLIDKF